MKTTKIMIAVALLALAAAGMGWAQVVPAAWNYQGLLSKSVGGIGGAGTYTMEFRIWDQEDGGVPVWARRYAVYVQSNGVFNVALDTSGVEILTPPQTSDVYAAFSGGPRYLGITVVATPQGAVSLTEMKPREQLFSQPFALYARSADNTDALQGIPASSLLPGPMYAGVGGNYPALYSPVTTMNVVTNSYLSYVQDVYGSYFLINAIGLGVNNSLTVHELVTSLLQGDAPFACPVEMLPPATNGLRYNLTNVGSVSLTAAADGILEIALSAFDTQVGRMPISLTISNPGRGLAPTSYSLQYGPNCSRYYSFLLAAQDQYVVSWNNPSYTFYPTLTLTFRSFGLTR